MVKSSSKNTKVSAKNSKQAKPYPDLQDDKLRIPYEAVGMNKPGFLTLHFALTKNNTSLCTTCEKKIRKDTRILHAGNKRFHISCISKQVSDMVLDFYADDIEEDWERVPGFHDVLKDTDRKKLDRASHYVHEV